MKIYTVTIWEKEERSPWTISFDNRDKADTFKALAEKMISLSNNHSLRVTIDSGELNDTGYYLECLSDELGVDVPSDDSPAKDCVKLYARYAINARYTAEVAVPKDQTPDKNASADEKEAFISLVSSEADCVYCEADFGNAEVIDGKIIYIEDKNGEFIWEDGRLCSGFDNLKDKSEE